MPEYGRNVLKMVEKMKEIPDREKRSAQARSIIKVMELLNPQVRQLDNFDHKLWDHLYIIAGFDLDVDAPYPAPSEDELHTRPVPIPMKDEKIKASHYGRNIEKIIGLLIDEPDSEVKTEMIRCLAIYMRQQYLIWNKDTVADETIFQDIERLSGGKVKVPEGLELTKISADASFSRPGMNLGFQTNKGGKFNRNYRSKNKKK
jgi:hypothetical protein